MTDTVTKPSDRLSAGRLTAFAGPAAPIAALGLPITVYLPPFYASELGLSLSMVGLAFTISRIWDTVTDPVLGFVSDRFPSRWGRRRHWLVLSVPIMLLSIFMIFMPPVSQASFSYLLGWMIFMYIGWTMLTISHMSWGAELSPDYDERSRIQGYREAALILGMLFVLTMPALLPTLFPDTEITQGDKVASMGWFSIVLLPLTVLLAVWLVPERPLKEKTAAPIHWRVALQELQHNGPLRRILAVDLFGGISGGVVTSLYLFLAADFLRVGDYSEWMLLAYFGSGVAFVPLILKLSYKFEKHRALAGTNLVTVIALPFVLILPKGEPFYAIILWIALGTHLGAGSLLIRAITADIVDLDRLKTGEERTGLFYAFINMTSKLGIAISVGIVYVVLEQVFGYQPGQENTDAAVNGLALLYVIFPVVLAIVNAVILWNFPINRAKQHEIRAQLDAIPGTIP